MDPVVLWVYALRERDEIWVATRGNPIKTISIGTTYSSDLNFKEKISAIDAVIQNKTLNIPPPPKDATIYMFNSNSKVNEGDSISIGVNYYDKIRIWDFTLTFF